jgi:hypothetical protein
VELEIRGGKKKAAITPARYNIGRCKQIDKTKDQGLQFT